MSELADLPESCLAGGDNSQLADLHRNLSSLSNVDHALYNDLVGMVPMVQSLINQKANSSFTRRGSVVYTKMPSIESRSKRISKSFPSKKALDEEKEKEELIALRQELKELQEKLLEKDELVLKSEEDAKMEMNSLQSKLDEMRKHDIEKDSIIRSAKQQLVDTKLKLADKQAAAERLQWEAKTSSQKVVKLQEDLHSLEEQMSSFMLFLENNFSNNLPSIINPYDFDVSPYNPADPYQDFDDVETREMELAHKTYVTAVAVVKEKRDKESIAAAERARLHLQSFVFRSNNM
ncbi:protein MICROTUBULE BINDING PROTEIN 2C-like [Impatiens glandulifera]|uniref:protein MICROTUBULE BINDING PROTEIN 2C-like n=1 Tax=Impatiens glandulifera TaxID=253017 RepID=UPI001FB0AF78|nr:protein MICROTUBULE BINDING PROTEIN 2C-like [Impatiens glandulifera]